MMIQSYNGIVTRNCPPQMFSNVTVNQISESKYLKLLKIREECKWIFNKQEQKWIV